jgi:hypothetical protein
MISKREAAQPPVLFSGFSQPGEPIEEKSNGLRLKR